VRQDEGEKITMAEHTLEIVNTESEYQRATCHPSYAPSGAGRYDDLYLCGRCGVIVARDVPLPQLAHALIRCPNCGAGNRARHLLTHLSQRQTAWPHDSKMDHD
jgi:DNA-directed RNA polymerase subunit RPC12/RpoP